MVAPATIAKGATTNVTEKKSTADLLGVQFLVSQEARMTITHFKGEAPLTA